jgi:hypothetical protein
MDSVYISSILIGLTIVSYLSLTGYTRPIAEKFVGGFTIDTIVKPNLWFVIDDTGTNSRKWADFGARNSNEPNVGFSSITKTRCNVTQGADFNVVELNGRKAVANRIFASGGDVPTLHMSAPNYLWRAWARSALLSQLGGLYLDGYSLCLGPSFKEVLGKDACVFGIDYNEYRGSGTKACGPYAGWSSKSGNKAWSTLTKALVELIDAGPLSWTAANAREQLAGWHSKYLASFMPCITDAEWTRTGDGEPLEFSDILGRSLSKEWQPPSNAIYLPIDIDKLERNVTYKWFLRMSTEQILDPNSLFIWAALAQQVGRNDKIL